MKKLSVVLCAMVLLFGVVGIANSALTTIGTATYMGSEYNLIYEDDSIDGGLVWLDYRSETDSWQNQVDWASGLGSNLTVNLYSGYTTDIDWGTGWRLPITDESQYNLFGGLGWEGPDAAGYHNYLYGYNMVNSEMGHLNYESLGNLGNYATDGTHPQPGWGLVNTGDFSNLQTSSYWSGTEYSPDPDYAGHFVFGNGYQRNINKSSNYEALAVHPGTVDAVPIPSAIWLLGSAFIGLVGFRKKIRKGGA